MTPAEESFIREIMVAVHSVSDFRQAVEDGLSDFMGQGPAQILVMSISNSGLTTPAQFVRAVSKTFGQGAVPMYTAILTTARNPEWIAEREAEKVELRPRTGGLGPAELGKLTDEERRIYLHDQRNPDDFSEEDPH